MTAFLPHSLGTNLDPANLEEFGPVVELLGKHRPSIWQSTQLVEAYRQALEREGYDPEVDHIVLTGKAIYIAMLVLALDPGPVRALIYDAPTNLYKETRIDRATTLRGSVQPRCDSRARDRTSSG